MTLNTEPLDFGNRLARKNLCLAIFDSLCERELLGILLSSKHFRLYFQKHFIEECGDTAVQALHQHLLSNHQDIHEVQLEILHIFNGYFIEEGKCESQEKLMRDLDRKYRNSFDSLPGECEPSHPDIIKIWNKRRSCLTEQFCQRLQA